MVTELYRVQSESKPGDVLLSHGEAPHYHRRYFVSLLSSARNQVGPKRYGRQANLVSFCLQLFKKAKSKKFGKLFLFKKSRSYTFNVLFESIKNPLGVVWLSLTGN